MIVTLFITVLVEGIIVSGYAIWRGKPLGPILLTSFIANLITQSLLWIGLNLFFQHYLSTLLIAEFFVWMIESVLLYYVPANRLRFTEALFLGMTINLVSFVLGWFLPV